MEVSFLHDTLPTTRDHRSALRAGFSCQVGGAVALACGVRCQGQ